MTYVRIGVLVPLLAFGCASPSAERPSCEALHEACHEAESLGAEALACHELGHDSTATEAACAAELPRCRVACLAPDAALADAGAPRDVGSAVSDAGTDAGAPDAYHDHDHAH